MFFYLLLFISFVLIFGQGFMLLCILTFGDGSYLITAGEEGIYLLYPLFFSKGSLENKTCWPHKTDNGISFI